MKELAIDRAEGEGERFESCSGVVEELVETRGAWQTISQRMGGW